MTDGSQFTGMRIIGVSLMSKTSSISGAIGFTKRNMIAKKIIIEERPCEIPLDEDKFIRAVASMIVKDILIERAGKSKDRFGASSPVLPLSVHKIEDAKHECNIRS
ncbi:MAG: hypothetical protein V1927_00480 [Candidatus Omnitrophota bacterium]